MRTPTTSVPTDPRGVGTLAFLDDDHLVWWSGRALGVLHLPSAAGWCSAGAGGGAHPDGGHGGITPDGRIFSAGPDGGAVLWDAGTGRPVDHVRLGAGPLHGIAALRGGGFAAGSYSGLRVVRPGAGGRWHRSWAAPPAAAGGPELPLRERDAEFPDEVAAVWGCRDGTAVAVLARGETVVLPDTLEGREAVRVGAVVNGAGAGRAALSRNGHRIAVTTVTRPREVPTAAGRTVHVLDLPGRPAGTLVSDSAVDAVALSPDAAVVALGSRARRGIPCGPVELWDVASGTLRARCPVGVPGTTAMAFSPDGRRLACGDREGTVTVHDLAGVLR